MPARPPGRGAADPGSSGDRGFGGMVGPEATIPNPRHPDRSGLHLRIVLEGRLALGPGRAELLELVANHGSIAAAGRAMGMSYRRAWTLLEDTARSFGGPVVHAAPGGAGGGGAALTPLGETLLALYRRIEARAEDAAAPELAELRRLMQNPPSKPITGSAA